MTLPFIVFVSLLAAVGLMRLGEVFVSARRIRARPGAVIKEPWLFPLMAFLHVAFVSMPAVEVLWWPRAFDPTLAIVAGAVFAAAIALRIWTLSTIGIAWNVRVVVPENDTICTSGPYRFIRHPNYLVVILEIASLPLLHAAWGSAVALTALNGVVLWHRIRTEEAALSQVPAWKAAMSDRKRLIPGVF